MILLPFALMLASAIALATGRESDAIAAFLVGIVALFFWAAVPRQ